MSFEKTLNDTDLRALSVAMYALVADSCMAAEALEDEEYEAAKVLSKRLAAETSLRSERAKTIASGAPVPLTHVGLGSIWEMNVEVGAFHSRNPGTEYTRTGCTWPVPMGFAECSFCAGGPMWAPDRETVRILAHGLSTEACDWVLSAKDDDADLLTGNDRHGWRDHRVLHGGT